MNPARRNLFTSLFQPGDNWADRRASCRYAPVSDAVTMGWWEDGQYRTQPCSLLDISMGGLGLRSAVAPQGVAEVGVKVGVGPEIEDREWVPVDLVRIIPLRRKGGPFKIQLRFRGSCPYEFFRDITAGGAIEVRILDAAPEFDPRYWR